MKIKAKLMVLAVAASATLFSGCFGWVGQFFGDVLGDALWLGVVD